LPSFTEIFGGNTINPSQVSYVRLSLDADTTLTWPLEAQVGDVVAASIIDIVTSGIYSVTLPDARLVSTGTLILFNCLGPDSVTVLNAVGDAVLTLTPGSVWAAYLNDNTSQQGSWRAFHFGAATAQAQASALAGAGLMADGATLAQNLTMSTIASGPYTIGASERAQGFIWEGALGTFNLPSASAVGGGWFVHTRNGGTGDLTIDPSGSETINGDSTLRLSPGDSAIIVTDGTDWWTIGLGQQAIFAFDYTAISLNGLGNAMTPTDYTLTGSELNRIVYKFTGTLAGDMEVIVPATVQQYWFDNSTTGGSYTVSIKAAGSATIIGVPRGQRGIYYCDGTQVIKADTTSGVPVPLTIAEGGTSATSAPNARTNLGAAASGANSDITSLSALSTPLSVGQGGTGAALTPTAGTVAYANGTGLALTAAGIAGQVLQSNGASPPSWATLAGAGTVTSVNASGGTTGLSFSGGPITSSGTLTLAGTLAVANGGTGATTAAAARLALLPSIVGKANQVLAVNTGATDVEWVVGGGGSGVSSFSAGTTGLTPNTATTGAVTLAGTLAIANGGTGSTTAAGARGMLQAAKNSDNTDIISIAGLNSGSAAAPTISFASETTTGFFRNGTAKIGFAGNGIRSGSLSSSDSDAVVFGPTNTAATGNYNVAIGTDAGDSFTGTTLAGNVFVGYQAGASAVSSTQGTYLGRAAGASATGNSNTCVGYNAGGNLTTGANNTLIGNGASASSATVSNEITLGNTSVATLRCQVALTVLSDARDKAQVTDFTDGLGLITRLRPVRFTWAPRDGGRAGVRDTGFLAQDLLLAQDISGVRVPGLVNSNNPERLEVTHEKLIPVLVDAVRELSERVKVLEAMLSDGR